MELPPLPAHLSEFIPYLAQNLQTKVESLLQPYKDFEGKLREIYAQEPQNPAIADPHVNTIPVFEGKQQELNVRARDLSLEADAEKETYLLPLPDDDRKVQGSPAAVQSFKEFQANFNVFSESSLVDLDWSNVIAAGSSVVTSLLPVKGPHNESKRALRQYYHEKLAPASDVDLFIYGLNEKQAVEKIKQVEARIRDSILSETTTIRTKNAITIVSEYPTRHVQIVLRLYKSVSEILTGFDVDCSCVAYDGSQVWASPRALAAFVTQVNTIDLSRRSPSYENRLSKYSHRGFEVRWPQLDRSRIDPTIFERSFSRVMGLARLLVLEKLPHPNDRDSYLAQRRAERGRPELPWNARWRRTLPGNVKDQQPDDVAEWVNEEEVSSYHTFTIPYGPKYNAKKINKLLFTKDLLLNAEWNRPKDRETVLHRHPAFFGSVEDVIGDCCGYCPEPVTDEDLAAAEEEEKIYISSEIKFIQDDPGRQAIGSFNPLTDDDWTEMAYVGNTARLCQAIVDGDIEHVQDWCSQEGVDVNRRDHTGRTPLHLATMCGTLEIVQCLIDNGARLVARLYDGFTALHIASHRGEARMVAALLRKSEENEEEEGRREDERKIARRAEKEKSTGGVDNVKHDEIAIDTDEVNESGIKDDDASDDGDEDEDVDMIDSDDSEPSDRMTEGSFVRVRNGRSPEGSAMPDDGDNDEPDVYDVNVLAWDLPVSPLHLAIARGHVEVIHTLVEHFGADVLLPVKLINEYDRRPREAILTLVVAMQLPLRKALDTTKVLLSLGASSSQADMDEITALHYVVSEGKTEILDTLFQFDGAAATTAINHLSITGYYTSPQVTTPLLTAIRSNRTDTAGRLLALGAEPSITLEMFARTYHRKFEYGTKDPEEIKKIFEKSIDQPVTEAINSEQITIAKALLEAGASPAILTKEGYCRSYDPDRTYFEDSSLLDLVQYKLERLRAFNANGNPKASNPPLTLDDDATYLDGLIKGTYRYWLAETDLRQAKAVSSALFEEHKEDLANEEPERGSEEKLEATQKVAKEFERLEEMMKAARAKTFYEMNPGIKKPEKDSRSSPAAHDQGKRPEPYKTDQNFLIPDLTPKKKEGYFKLFEAAWKGDIQTIKMLTLSEWDGSHAPLLVTASDLRHFTPFTLAVLRGHFECAKCILDIATVQYEPNDKKDRIRYSLRPNYSEDESVDGSDDDMNLHEELVDANYTIEDMGALSRTVKSKTSPLSLFYSFNLELWRFVPLDERDAKELFQPKQKTTSTYYWLERYTWDHHRFVFTYESQRVQHSLMRYAVVQNNISMFRFLVEKGRELCASANDDNPLFYSVSSEDFDLAVRLGRVEMIGEIIKCTGTKLPLSALAKISGVEVDEKPKYYQGLSVHGKKRKDWADAGRGIFSQPIETLEPPLTQVIFAGNIEPTEYFLGDAPFRRYKEFAETNRADTRIATLFQAEGGIDKALSRWLTSQIDLTLHIAVMCEPNVNATAQLEYLVKVFPQLVSHTPQPSRMTPLALALQLRRVSAIRTLLASNADQAARDISGRNMIHIIVQDVSTWSVKNSKSTAYVLRTVIDLLDSSLLKTMFLERCSLDNPAVPNGIHASGAGPGSTTPLALLLHSSSFDPEVLSLLLEYSKGIDLGIMDGAGDYPLHVVTRDGRTDLAKIVLDRKPEMLFWENATGMTPYDIMQQDLLKTSFRGTPSIPLSASLYGVLDQPPTSFVDKGSAAEKKKAEKEQFEKASTTSETIEQVETEDDESDYDGNNQNALLFRETIRHSHSQQKRKLVSLYDANEVAKRLARRQTEQNKEKNQTLGKSDRDSEDGDMREAKKKAEAADIFDSASTGLMGRAVEARKWDLEDLENEGKEKGEWKDDEDEDGE